MAGRPLLLARHAETEWNACGRLQGREDSPLTVRGLGQAAALGALARAWGVRHVATSALGRARATGAVVALACGAAESVHEPLAEISFGRCAGWTLEQVREREPEWWRERERDRWNARWPGGESYADAALRLAAWLPDGALEQLERPTLVVAHQSVLRALLVAAAGWPAARALAVPFAACEAWRLSEDGACVRQLPEATPPVRA